MRNLALGFTSLRPASLPENVCDAREDEYLICLKQLKRVLPKSFDFIICENTIDDPQQIKSLSILKSLAATNRYGGIARGGAIVIRLKK